MHKGHMSHRIIVKGQSGHSSKPDLGINAIEIMYQVIGQLIKLKQLFIEQYHNAHFDVSAPTLNFGAIKGGDNANRICGYCHLDIDLRSLPNMSDDDLLVLLAQALKPLVAKYYGRISIEELHASSPSFEQKKPSELIDFAEQISEQQCCAVNYATEAPFIQQLGCQTIVMGPGSIDQAHQPNEFLAFDQITKTQQLLLQLINKYC
jgi:acetylornithine deacetylase